MLARAERIADEAIELARLHRNAEANTLLNSERFQHAMRTADRQMAEIAAVKDSNARSTIYQIRQFALTSSTLTYALLIGGLAVALLCAWWISISIRRPVNRLREAVDALAAGQLDSVIPHTDYQNETGDLARAIAKLQAESRQLDMQRWIKSQEASIQAELQQAASLDQAAQRLLTLLAPLVQAGQGALYLLDEDAAALRLAASYAADPDHPRRRNWRWAVACWASARRTASRSDSTPCRKTTRRFTRSWGGRAHATCRCCHCCTASA